MMRDALRKAGRILPPLRRLHDFALRAESGRQIALAEVATLEARLKDLEAEAASRPAETASAAAMAKQAASREAALVRQLEELQAETKPYAHWAYLKRRHQLVELDFPVKPRVRYGHGSPSEPLMRQKLEAGADHYATVIERLLPLLAPMLTISPEPVADASEPNWINLAFPALDAMALYGMIADRRPRQFLEIGSGFSTKFARRAIRDHGLSTRIVSIDPEPRAEVDQICDEVLRVPLEDAPLTIFEQLTADDLVFFDGSHRAFQNSDVTVFFTEILPRLPRGIMVAIHDIFLPADYPPDWLDWYFSEQYLLTCWLLAGDRLKIEFPAAFVGETDALHARFAPFWSHPALAGANHKGGTFFCTIA